MTSGIAHCSLDGQLESFHCPQQTPAFGWYQQHSFYYLETTDQHSMHRQRCFNDVADNHNTSLVHLYPWRLKIHENHPLEVVSRHDERNFEGY